MRAPVGLAGLLIALTLAGCSPGNPPPLAPVSPASPVPVEIVTLEQQTLHSSITAFGVIEALEEVNVAAELSGTVVAVHVNEGDRVETGQLLLELDAEKRQLALNRADNEVEQARAALDEARLRLQRRLNLAEKETISQEILDNTQLAVDKASARYQQVLASRQLAQRELADTRIISPTNGLVDIRAVEPGEPVTTGASLVTLQTVATLRVQTWVSEADVSYLRAGSSARVYPSGMPNREFPARIEWIGVNADNQTGNFPVKLIMEAGLDSLRPGMTVSVAMQTEEISGALVLPERALVDHERRRIVFLERNGLAEIREPVLAAGLSNNLLILSGLAPGDRVIVSGQQRLVDGAKVLAEKSE
jgi:membrane fusion protein, multidrug efflux system